MLLFVSRILLHPTCTRPLNRLPVLVLLTVILVAMAPLPRSLAASPQACPPEYQRALDATEQARQAGQGTRELSDTLLWGAGKCRDASAHACAEELFRAAVAEDPLNARAHRVYGDYLMGYRGLYEYAAFHYYAALAIVRNEPDAHSDEFKQSLERSFQILHRDGNDGMALIRSHPLSVFVDGSVSYGKTSPKHIDILGQQLQAECYYNGPYREEREDGIGYFSELIAEQNGGIRFFKGAATDNEKGFDQWLDNLYDRFMNDYGYRPDDDEILDIVDGDVVTIDTRRSDKDDYTKVLKGKAKDIEKEKWKTQQKIKDLEQEIAEIPDKIKAVPRKLPRRKEEREYKTAVLVRFGHTALPYLKISFERLEVANAGINPEDLEHTYDGTYTRTAALLGKNVRLPLTIDVHAEIEASRRKARLYDSYHGHRVYEEKTDELRGETAISGHIGRNVLKLMLGGTVADIENDYSDDDSAHSQWTGLRLSAYPAPKKLATAHRYRGRRSSHWETGARRYERDYESSEDPTITETTYQPYATWEEYGLLRGAIDLLLKYEFNLREFSTGCPEGSYRAHELTFQPTWVPVYHLYDNDFWAGLEHMTVSLPLRWSFGEGDYDRLSAGLGFEQRFVTRLGAAIHPSISFDYAVYPDLDRDDWGIFAKCAFTPGARRHLPPPAKAPHKAGAWTN